MARAFNLSNGSDWDDGIDSSQAQNDNSGSEGDDIWYKLNGD